MAEIGKVDPQFEELDKARKDLSHCLARVVNKWTEAPSVVDAIEHYIEAKIRVSIRRDR